MIISSRKNPAAAHFRELNKDRRSRTDEQKFNVEGVRLCLEAVRSGQIVTNAFVTVSAAEKYPEALAEFRQYCEPAVISDEIGEYISDTKSPQGFFATLRIPEQKSFPENGSFIILDGLQDAGNVGTVIRTCDALGIGGVVLSPDCADIFSPKVVRGAMGSLFRLPFAVTELPCFIAGLQADNYSVYAAVLDKTAQSIGDVEFPEKCAVVIGNEGNGVSPEVIAAAGNCIYIPIVNAESLNASVAAAIFCYEITKDRNKQ